MCCQYSSEVLFDRSGCASIDVMKNSMDSQINKPEIKYFLLY